MPFWIIEFYGSRLRFRPNTAMVLVFTVLAWLCIALAPATASELVHVAPELIFTADTGTVMVPLDFAADVNRAVAGYEPESGVIEITGRDIVLRMQVCNQHFLINGKQWVTLETPPAELAVDDKQLCLVPLREVSTLLGGAVFEREGNLFVKRPPEKTLLTRETARLLDKLEVKHGPAEPEPESEPPAQPVPEPVHPAAPKPRIPRSQWQASSTPRLSLQLGASSYVPKGGDVSRDRFEHNLARRAAVRAALGKRFDIEVGYSRWESSMTGYIPEFVNSTQSGTLRVLNQTYHAAIRFRQAITPDITLSVAPGVIRSKARFDVVHKLANYSSSDIDNGIYLDVCFDYWFNPSAAFWLGAVLTRSSVRLENPGITVSMDDITPGAGFMLGF